MYNDTSGPSNKREHIVLKRGVWTHSLNKKIWEASKCPCTIAFKRGKVYPHGILKCLDIIGVCTECNAQLRIYSESLPHDGTHLWYYTVKLRRLRITALGGRRGSYQAHTETRSQRSCGKAEKCHMSGVLQLPMK